MKKKILLLLVMSVLLNGFVVFANTDGNIENFKFVRQYAANQFVDVSSSDWYAESVKTAYELSLVNGTSNTTFSPNDNITIAETITLASRLNNVYYGSSHVFAASDVWYQTYVDYAIQKGIIQENEYNNFDEFATRSQFAQIFSSALPDDALQVINQVADNSIPDVPMQSDYSNAVYKLYRAGILTGNDASGTFAPDTNIQRSAVATIVSRMAKQELRKEFILNSDDDTNSILPPSNIRIVRQTIDSVYINWDKADGADYYYLYYQEDGEDTFWYDVDENNEQIRMTHDSEYSAVFYGLENGKKYNIIATSVKDGVESNDSEIFSFVFNTNEFKLDSEEISKKCSPAVFYIEVYGFNGQRRSSGSGFFITSDGIAITNYHVVADGFYFNITTTDGKIYDDIKIIDLDKKNDLALLKIGGADFPYLEMGNSELIKQGQHVYAIGSPLGLSNTMSEGIISNSSRIIDDVEFIQISVPVNHGSSGGALIDEYGNVIGVTSARFNTTGDLNLAIPINRAQNLNFHSTDDYYVWADTYYPGFSQVLDFGYFSGVKLLSSYGTMISFEEEYDIYDFHDIGPHDAGICYANTVLLYGEALKQNGMTEEIISDMEFKFESDAETVRIKSDFETEKITISAQKKPVFYNEIPGLLDFGWYSDMPMAYIPDCTGDSILYSYKWRDYYDQWDYANVLYTYFLELEKSGYEFMTAEETEDGYIGYLFEGNNLYIVLLLTDSEMYIDVSEL